MILITKGGLSRGGDNEMPENCLYDCRLRDTCIYVPRWADEETLLRIGTERSKSCPLIEVADRKTENNSEIPNNSTISKMEHVDKDINVRSKDCTTCRHAGENYEDPCELCYRHSHYEPKDEPQTERSE